MSIDAVDSGVAHAHIVQNQQTRLEFLIHRASQIGYELAMDGAKLLFRPIANKAPAVATLRLDDDLLEFRPRMSLQPVTEVAAVAWDPKQKATITASANAASIAAMDGKKLGTTVASDVLGNEVEKLRGKPVASQAEANQLAVAQLELSSGEREAWLKALKQSLGCGGAVEGDLLVLQGDQRDRVARWLQARGVRKVTVGT